MRGSRDHLRWSDDELLRGIADYDRDAFAAFYRRHLPTVVAFLARETRDRELTADLTAEVFAAVALAARRYQPSHPSAAPWLIGIARNTLGTSRRRGRAEMRARRRLGFEPLALLDSDLQRVDALTDDGHARVRALVETLPEDERQAVAQRVVHEREYADIAAELHCSEMVVRKRVSRGLARMREQFKEP
ncbi:MAG: RNA polymerase sigma factor [Solirubrobacteraceae bacterium]